MSFGHCENCWMICEIRKNGVHFDIHRSVTKWLTALNFSWCLLIRPTALPNKQLNLLKLFSECLKTKIVYSRTDLRTHAFWTLFTWTSSMVSTDKSAMDVRFSSSLYSKCCGTRAGDQDSGAAHLPVAWVQSRKRFVHHDMSSGTSKKRGSVQTNNNGVYVCFLNTSEMPP